MKQGGGADIMFELRNLAVPFVLMLSKNAIEYMKDKKMATKPTKPKPSSLPRKNKTTDKKKTATKRGGGCGCSGKGATISGGGSEIDNLARNLSNIINAYR